jgi:hypothetical protein
VGASADLTFKVKDDPFEVGVIQDGLVFGGAQQQGVATQVVDLAGHAFGVVVDAGDEALAEELVLTCSAKLSLPFCENFFPLECRFDQVEYDHINDDQNCRHDQ